MLLQKSLFTAVLAATAIAATASMDASAIGRLADVTVTDRDSGQTLPLYFAKGQYWVAGTPGASYSVSVANATGGRVMAVMSVDGVNVLNGETAGTEQPGYVFNPYQRYDVTGWRKNNSEVAAFEFVAASGSYAERTGRPANVGVIGVALFKERVYQPPVIVTPPYQPYPYEGRRSAPYGTNQSGADSATGEVGGSAKRSKSHAGPTAESSEPLGTGHGEREYSQVSNTTFVRAQPRPNEVISIRYDSHENLVSMGVIPAPYYGSGRPRPFPNGQGFVPDPPRYYRY